MILVFVLAAWIVLLSLVVGLCAAARAGDAPHPVRARAFAGWERAQAPTWEPAERSSLSARTHPRRLRRRDADASLARRDGIAA